MANKSKTYLLPYMAEYIKLRFINRLLDTYTFFNGEYFFCLKYEFTAKKIFMDYEESLMQNQYFVDSVDVTKEEVVYIFAYPEELIPVVNLFVEGKYSYLPQKAVIKEFIMKNFQITTDHRIFHILDRTEELRIALQQSLGVELDPKLDLESPPDKDSEELIV